MGVLPTMASIQDRQHFDMKTVIYIILFVGAVMLATSKELRSKAMNVVKMVGHGLEQLVIRGDHAEIRSVEASNFDLVINEPGRVVVVVIDSHLKASKAEGQALDDEFEKLPGKVLVAKVGADGNSALLQKLKIRRLPNFRIYRNGKLLGEFHGAGSKDELIKAIQYNLDRGDTTSSRSRGEIKPLGK